MASTDTSFTASLVSGAVAGTVVDVALFPLDTIKTRLQSSKGFWNSGGYRGIYSGLSAAALGSAPGAALFFATYETVKHVQKSSFATPEFTWHMTAASLGEVVACLVRVPVEVVKQRSQASGIKSWTVYKNVLTLEGVGGFYRGYWSTVLREIPFSLVQFPVWEYLKKLWAHKQGRPIEPWQSSLCGAVAGGTAAAVTTPLDVAKTRIMLAEKDSVSSKGYVLKVLREVWLESGFKGLFAGLVPRVLWISVGGAIFLGSYEKSKSFMQPIKPMNILILFCCDCQWHPPVENPMEKPANMVDKIKPKRLNMDRMRRRNAANLTLNRKKKEKENMIQSAHPTDEPIVVQETPQNTAASVVVMLPQNIAATVGVTSQNIASPVGATSQDIAAPVAKTPQKIVSPVMNPQNIQTPVVVTTRNNNKEIQEAMQTNDDVPTMITADHQPVQINEDSNRETIVTISSITSVQDNIDLTLFRFLKSICSRCPGWTLNFTQKIVNSEITVFSPKYKVTVFVQVTDELCDTKVKVCGFTLPVNHAFWKENSMRGSKDDVIATIQSLDSWIPCVNIIHNTDTTAPSTKCSILCALPRAICTPCRIRITEKVKLLGEKKPATATVNNRYLTHAQLQQKLRIMSRALSASKLREKRMEDKLGKITNDKDDELTAFVSDGLMITLKEHVEDMSDVQKMFIEHQIKAASVKKRGMRWDSKLVQFGHQLWRKSQGAYKILYNNEFFKLPSERIIRRYESDCGKNQDETLNEVVNSVQVEAGGLAGGLSDFILFPLDTTRTRFQSKKGFTNSGGFRKVYSGFPVVALGSTPSSALFFLSYEFIKRHQNRTVLVPDFINHIVASSWAEVVVSFIRVPVEVVKQRAQATSLPCSVIFKNVMKTEGAAGLYRGYLVTIIRDAKLNKGYAIPFSCCQFPIWEFLKKKWSQHQGRKIEAWQSAGCGSIAGGIAGFVTTPLDLAKTRIILSDAGTKTSQAFIFEILNKIYRRNGLKGLFVGATSRVIWVAMSGGLFLGLFEKFKQTRNYVLIRCKKIIFLFLAHLCVMTTYKLVTFDVTNTLLKFTIPPVQQYASAAKQYKISFKEDKLPAAFKSQWKKLNQQHPNFGASTGLKSSKWWMEFVKGTFREADCKAKEIQLYRLGDYLINLFKSKSCWEVVSGSDEVLKRLKQQNIKLGIISNFDERLDGILKEVELHHYFDFVICSYMAKCAKPDSKIFDLALKQVDLGIIASEAIHVGNDLQLDYLAARNAGWNSLLVVNTGEHQPKECARTMAASYVRKLRTSIWYLCPKFRPITSKINQFVLIKCKQEAKQNFNKCGRCLANYYANNSNKQNTSTSPADESALTLAGILSFLGFGPKEKEDELIHTIKLAVLAMQKGNLDNAEQILHVALRMAQDKTEQQGITYIYDMLANVAYQKGDYRKAEKLFIETMKRLLISGKPVTDNAIVEISLKLAHIYSILDMDKKAEEGFMFCIRTQQKKLDDMKINSDDDTKLLWAMSVDYYARHLMKNSRLAKARYYFEQALTVSTEVNGKNHPQTVVLLNDLGSLYSLLKDPEMAVTYLKEAISVGTEINSPDLPSFYCNLGAVYLQTGKYEDARSMCEQGRRLAIKIGNKEAEVEADDCLRELKKTNEKLLA
uniref:Uncharacterized protein n=1 Tax=Strigamia maritima TaxID=126957 RepID=T1IUQ4_STRMM